MGRAAHVHIDLGALRHNFQRVRELAPTSAVLAMVKADAYGHGLVQIAQTLSDADALGVACIEEALRLREAGVKQRIVLMEGFFDANELALIVQHRLEMMVHHFAQIEALESTPLFHPINVWLKIDSGMHRLGFSPKEVPEAWHRLYACPWVNPEPVLVTHFAVADDVENDHTALQIAAFNHAVAGLPGKHSLANSAAILAWPNAHADWVRPGLMLYGVSPFADKIGSDFGLQPVMTVASELIAIREVPKGARVGYGRTWVCPEDMRIGVVAIGYGDGYPLQAGNGTPVLLNNRRVPLAGRVAMDMLTIDLRTQPNAKIGDRVVLWGNGLPIEIIARHAGTASYELLCGVTQRIQQANKSNRPAIGLVSNQVF